MHTGHVRTRYTDTDPVNILLSLAVTDRLLEKCPRIAAVQGPAWSLRSRVALVPRYCMEDGAGRELRDLLRLPWYLGWDCVGGRGGGGGIC